MESKQLHYFISVAEQGSFSKAEEIEYISKQALMKQLNNLEAEVGIPLLIRSGSGVTLTEAGTHFLEGARKLLASKDALIHECRNIADYREILRMSNVEHQKMLTPVTNEFLRRYPDTELSYVIHPNHSGEYRVSHNLVDVGETFHVPQEEHIAFPRPLPPDAPKDLRKEAENLSYTRLADFPYAAVMSASHPLSGKNFVKFSELADYEVSYFLPITRAPLQHEMQKAFANRPEALDGRVDVDNQIPVTFDCIATGRILVTCNPYIYYLPDLRVIPLEPAYTMEYGIITSRHPSPVVLRYKELALQIFHKNGADAVIHHR